jgi:endonuclease IV
MLLGAHVPTAGGLDQAPARGRENDAGRPLGSRRDRHAPIGSGFLDRAMFRRLVNDPRFHGVPMVLETPGPLPVWKRELTLLRSLVGRGRGGA